jgi:hypothetical protein
VRPFAPEARRIVDVGQRSHFATVAIIALFAAPSDGSARTEMPSAGPSGVVTTPLIRSSLAFGVSRMRRRMGPLQEGARHQGPSDASGFALAVDSRSRIASDNGRYQHPVNDLLNEEASQQQDDRRDVEAAEIG